MHVVYSMYNNLHHMWYRHSISVKTRIHVTNWTRHDTTSTWHDMTRHPHMAWHDVKSPTANPWLIRLPPPSCTEGLLAGRAPPSSSSRRPPAWSWPASSLCPPRWGCWWPWSSAAAAGPLAAAGCSLHPRCPARSKTNVEFVSNVCFMFSF